MIPNVNASVTIILVFQCHTIFLLLVYILFQHNFKRYEPQVCNSFQFYD